MGGGIRKLQKGGGRRRMPAGQPSLGGDASTLRVLTHHAIFFCFPFVSGRLRRSENAGCNRRPPNASRGLFIGLERCAQPRGNSALQGGGWRRMRAGQGGGGSTQSRPPNSGGFRFRVSERVGSLSWVDGSGGIESAGMARALQNAQWAFFGEGCGRVHCGA
jgi:hypothetical protein